VCFFLSFVDKFGAHSSPGMSISMFCLWCLVLKIPLHCCLIAPGLVWACRVSYSSEFFFSLFSIMGELFGPPIMWMHLVVEVFYYGNVLGCLFAVGFPLM